jgi:integrase
MAPRKRRPSPRFRVGKVSVYEHHGAWWVYYRDGGQPQRRKIGASRQEAEQVAAQVNAQLASGAPRLLTFEPIDVPELRRQFLEYHEKVLHSSVGTVRRYRAATQHLEVRPYFVRQRQVG